MASLPKAEQKPFDLPDQMENSIWNLRNKLLSTEICEDATRVWTWGRIECSLQEDFGFTPALTELLHGFGEHFFPKTLAEHGYHVPKSHSYFRCSLPNTETNVAIWQAAPYGPFRYNIATSELELKLPLKDDDVFLQLSKLRQLTAPEQHAVSDLYYAPRLAAIPFAALFSDFSEAVEQLVQEPCERKRFTFFQKHFALFHRKCHIISEHLAAHVNDYRDKNLCHDQHRPHCDSKVSWTILKHLYADENRPNASWEDDIGRLPPSSSFAWQHKFTAGAFPALLGLTGTGLLGHYKVGDTRCWQEIRGRMRLFGSARNKHNIPVPMVIPSLDIAATESQHNFVGFRNGLAFGTECECDGDCACDRDLGGVQPFEVTWVGALLIECKGLYRFRADSHLLKTHEFSWSIDISQQARGCCIDSPHCDDSGKWLDEGVHNITIKFCQTIISFAADTRLYHAHTGVNFCYCGPDTDGDFEVIPIEKLFICSKDGLLEQDCPVSSNASRYLAGRYYSTIRDLRRTYQRAFKVALFAHRLKLSATPHHKCENETEIQYMLTHSKNFTGTTYYKDAQGKWISHKADFDFNLLPVADSYLSPSANIDQREAPSAKRTAAMFDWFERIFDYTRLRENVRRLGHRRFKEPVWFLFHQAATTTETPAELIRYLDIGSSFASQTLTYFQNFQVTREDLEDERWIIRVWNSRCWLERVQQGFFTRSISSTRPDLWAAEDPDLRISNPGSSQVLSGNSNLVSFVQKSALIDCSPPRFRDVRFLNDGLRDRARTALISYLCAMDRVTLPGGSFAKVPEDISAYLLQDVQACRSEKSSRIDDAICAVQMLVQRALLGLEPQIILSKGFVHGWQDIYDTFERWIVRQRRKIYAENWILWEDVKTARNSEAFQFLEQQLKRHTLTIPFSDPSLPLQSQPEQGLPSGTFDPIQAAQSASLNLQNSAPSEGCALMATPDCGGQPTLLSSASALADVVPVSGPVTVPEGPPRVVLLANSPTESPSHVGESSSRGPTTLTPSTSSDSSSAQRTSDIHTAHAMSSPISQTSALNVNFPMWFQAAIQMGTSFIRVAAAGIPPAFTFVPECRVGRQFQMDEYYFWLGEGKRFAASDAAQDPDIQDSGAPLTVPDPTSAWDETDQLPKLLHWAAEPCIHLYWTRIHFGEFQPTRRSEDGVPLQLASVVDLAFLGRHVDSLIFTVDGTNGFRYDVASDTATVTPQDVTQSYPQTTLPQHLSAFPYFTYFRPGAPLVPISSFCVSLTVARSLKTVGKFDEALKWCRTAFDVMQFSNKWAQYPTNSNDSNSTISHDTARQENNKSVESQRNTSTEQEGRRPGYLPCCPTSPVGPLISRSRAIVLEYVDILCSWADRLSCHVSSDNETQIFVLLSEAGRLLGQRPVRLQVQDNGIGEDMTVASFEALSAPLNPRLMALYDQLAAACGKRDECGARDDDFLPNASCHASISCLSCSQPYRFGAILPKAMETVNVVKALGSELLAAFEKADGERLAALRATHERHILDLGLEVRQYQWREADWQVQALQSQMQGALAKSRYYQGLVQVGLIADETDFVAGVQNTSSNRAATAVSDSIGQGMTIIPDFALGVAGLGPYQSTKIPIGSKLAQMFAIEAKMLNSVADASAANASLSTVNAGWARRGQEWQQQIQLASYEIAQLKCQTLAAERRRDGLLRELNSHQQQMKHCAEVEDFMRDKFTKQDMYLFLQQETAGLYRRAYDLALETTAKTQEAFSFERGIDFDILPEVGWDSLREGLLAGERLQNGLQLLERKYMDLNHREHELTKHISLKDNFPLAFLLLRARGWCEVQLPEWIFDKDYPGQYMRRITSVALSVPCVTTPYRGIHCCLRLLNSSIRVDPTVSGTVCQCCDDKPRAENDIGGHIIKRWASSKEAIATSSGINDAGLFELNFHDERYLPFEFHGAISTWRLELPQENNAFNLTSLTDVIIHLTYTSREGGTDLKELARKRANRYLPGDGVVLVDMKQAFCNSVATNCKSSKPEGHLQISLKLRRGLFPFLPGRQKIKVTQFEVFAETAQEVDPGGHMEVVFVPAQDVCETYQEECVVSLLAPRVYHGTFQVELGIIECDAQAEEFGYFILPRWLRDAEQFCLLYGYTVADSGC